MSNAVERFVSRYRALGLSGTPATPEEVEALEKKLGVMFIRYLKLPASKGAANPVRRLARRRLRTSACSRTSELPSTEDRCEGMNAGESNP